ncbi:MAG TPA: hypothetical protein VJN43_21760 [Bryobacteraceae bacterium]|nr:hypothetical protein [Bryobacteraceae bacterium]
MEPAKPKLDEQIDRYVRGELTTDEARKLAQESLNSPELFEELTYSAIAKQGLASGAIPQANFVQIRPRSRFLAPAAIAATVVLAASLYFWKAREFPGAEIRPARQTAAELRAKPTLTFSPGSAQPILIAADLNPRSSHAELFRGAEPEGRAPHAEGKIVSIEERVASINLGSIDGLAKGTELDVFRDTNSKQPDGRLRVTTVFRDRARAEVRAGGLRAGDQVRVPAAVHLSAQTDQAEALFGRGERDAGLQMADQAIREAATAPPGERRKAVERLAALQYQAGAFEPAEARYEGAAGSLDQPPVATPAERAEVWNSLAVIRMLRGDYAGAQAALDQASKSAGPEVAPVQNLNNRGALAELRGDRRKAETLYSQALAALAPAAAEQRPIIETNLARVKGSHP